MPIEAAAEVLISHQAWLLREENLLANPPNMPRQPVSFDLKPKVPPLRPQAKAMISLFMHGGPSHVDLFDPKPELTKRSGEAIDSTVLTVKRR